MQGDFCKFILCTSIIIGEVQDIFVIQGLISKFHKLEQVIFAAIVDCKNDDGSVLFCFHPLETIG